jgi:oligopeptidase B
MVQDAPPPGPDRKSFPPEAARHPVRHVRHGRTDLDPYDWLRARNWQEVLRDTGALSPEIHAHIEAENAYATTVLEPLAGLVSELSTELRARIPEADASVPVDDGSWSYFERFAPGAQHAEYCRVPGDGGSARATVLLDGEREAAGGFLRIARCRHSADHRLLAYTADRSGAEVYRLTVRDIDSGKDIETLPAECHGDFDWASDGRTLFYTVIDEHHRPRAVMRHTVGTDPTTDPVVYEEPDPAFFLGLERTDSGRFIAIRCHDHGLTSEVRLIDRDSIDFTPRLVAARASGNDYTVTDDGERLFVLTNSGDAEDYRIAEAPLDAPGRENWSDVVPHVPGRTIRAMLAVRGHLVRLERVDARPRIVVRRIGDGTETAVSFAEQAFDVGLVRGINFNAPFFRFTYSSPATPPRTYDQDLEGGRRTLRKEQAVPSGHDPADYTVQRLDVPAHDGAAVPVTLLYRSDRPPSPGSPLLLYGYGSYGISISASFVANRFSLVDRGVTYAIAHVRGGGDKGLAWYRDGKMASKENTFRDYLSVAHHLIGSGYTGKGRIVAHGGSAGGMLVGAALNACPDLFAAAIAEVPFVDVLNTMCDASLPLTPPEWNEWGNPVDDAEACDRIRGYSPYDNIRPLPYPPVLAVTGLTDPRVTYWEPAKWVARLRATATGGGPFLLRTNMGAGHAGAAGRFDRLGEIALLYAFVLARTRSVA